MIKIQVGPRAFAIQPQPTTPIVVGTGNPFSMTSAAVGGDSVPRYQWYKGNPGDTSTPVGTAFSGTYSVASAVPASAGTYFMRATNLLGFLDSNPVTVTISTPVTISGQPAGGNKAVGGTHTFSVTASGGAGALTYNLYKGGVLTSTNGTGSFTLNPLVAGDQANYYITVTDGASTATSSTVSLTVLAIGTQPVAPAAQTSGADGVTMTTVIAAGSGSGAYGYLWYKSTDGGGTWATTGITTSVLTFNNIMVTDAGMYRCTVNDAFATLISNAVTLGVTAAAITAPALANQTLSVSQPAAQWNATPTAGGSGPGFTYSYLWQKSTDGGATWGSLGVTTATYTPPTALPADAGMYRCQIGETPGTRPPSAYVYTTGGTLTLNSINVTASAPGAASVWVSQTATFTSTLGASYGNVSYQWEFSTNGGTTWAIVLGGTNATGTNVAPGPQTYTTVATTLAMNTYQYRVRVTSFGQPTQITPSAGAVLTVNQVVPAATATTPAAPTLTVSQTQLLSSTISQPGPAGTTMSYLWQKSTDNGATWNTIAATAGTTTTTPSAQNYTVPAVAFTDNGAQFRIAVTVVFGGSTNTVYSAPAVITVIHPTLTGSQPGDQTRYVGLTAIFTSTVTATVGQVTYQWQVSTDGGATYGDIGGATATVATGTAVNYTTPTLALTDNNKKYRVKLTSPIDASMPVVYSAAGTLTVNTNTISVSAVSPAAPTIYVNATQLYTATPTSTATGANALEYIWERSTNGGTTWTPIGAYAPATSGAPVNYTTPVQATPSANQTFHVIVRVAAQTTVNATSGPASLTVNATTPAITVQPVSATINVGATNTFTCTATVPVGTISAQWQRSDDGGTTWNPVGAAIPGVASGATVSFATPVASVTVDNGDRYRCVLTSSNDSTSITTNTLPVVAAILTVNNLALNIAPNPAAADRYVGQTAVFTTGATGGFGTITYQWQVSTDGGTVWNNVAGGSGAATASYTTAALVVGDNNKLFRCRVGDGVKPPDAYQYSGTALLHVQPVLSLAGLTGANLIENSPIALSVTPTGGYAPLSYQWEFNPGTGWVNLGGPTPSATYSVANAFFVNEGQYRVTVTDNLSTTAAAGPVTVTVLEISADPASIGRTAGQNYTPTVTVVPTSGNGAVTYQWQVSTNSGTTWNNVVADARHLNVTTNALTINALVVGDAGWYRCVVRDNGGTGVTLPSGVSVLTVTANPIVPVTQPLAGSRYPTQNYTFTAEASGGVGTRSYQWKFSTDGGTTWGNVGAVQTTVPATLALTGLTAANGGRYKCTVTDQSLPTAQTLDLGGLTGVLLTITPAAVAITAEPVDRNILVTQNTTFGVTATNGGTVGTVTYQWESSANGSTGWANVAGGSGGASATYTTPTFAAPQNGPYYRCVLQNNANAVGAYLTYSAVVYLTVSWVTITVAPQPAPSTVWASQNATFTTGATSTIGTLSYQWQFNPGTGFVNTGAPGATLNITGAQAANAGSYQCVISNSANVGGPTQTSNAVVLTVLSTTPSITTGPASQSAYVSQTLTFGAVASLPTTPPGVPGGMTHQWQVSADNGATWNPVVGGSGASTASYTTATLTAADNAKQFRCVVTSTANSQSVNSSAATATVNATPAAATAVAPASVSKYVTETAGPFTSTVSAPYGTVSYVWQKKLSAGAWNDILGTSVSNAATGAVASYTTPALLAADDNSSYRVHVTSDADASTADSGVGVVTLLVATPTYGAINNPSVLASQTATLSVVANVPVGNLNYQWQISTDGGATWGSVTGGTGGSGSGVASGTTLQYTTPALTTANDNGKYRAQVTAVADSTVNVGPVGTVNVTLGAIVITGQPAGANKLAGGSLTMTVTATNDLAGGLTYQWQSSPDGTTWGDLADAAGHIAGASTDSLALTGLLLADKGYYRCLVGDAGRAGADRVATNGGAFLDVRTPVNITVPPAGANKKMGDSHTFTITAQDGYTPYTYKWLRGAAQIGSNSDTLALTNLTYADQGAYTCEITGAGGTTTASVPVDLTVLEIQTQPLPQTASVHGSATFSVAVTASSGLPGYTYQWKYLGADIAGAIGDTLTLSDVQAGSPDGSVLPINPAGSAGAYQCAVMDNAGVVLDSAVAALTVNSTPLAVTAPVSGRVHIGDSFSFTVTASDGYGPAYTYQWQQDGSDLSGETSATLNISSATPASAGSYVCRVGEQDVRPPLALVDSLAGTLQVAPPVSITGEPAGADLYVGESFTATVAATGGFGVISHQWYKDGVPMPGETGDTLTIDPVALGDAASYTAAATDEDASTATSQAAELTVVPHVSVTAHPAGGQMQLGTPFMLTVAGAGGKGMLHYAWYKGAVQVGPDSATYTITAPGPSDVGSYHCMVYDSATPVFDSALSDAVTVSINVVFGFSVVPQPNAVYVGDTVTLLADTQFVTGSVTYTWYDPAGAVIPQSLFDAPNTRKLANLQPAQSGDYYVVAVDDMGTPDPADDLTLTSPMAKLTVAEHLSITKQPESGMKAEGDSVVLTVETVGGVPPLIYEWRVDGANTVVGDEATLTLSGLTAADEGTYYVTIMDANGESVESDHVLVKVISGMPVAAPLGLALLAAGMALAGRRVLRRKC
jgi:hypothetical protein